MFTEEQIINSLGNAILDPTFNIESTMENTPNWDSLGQLAIIATLSKMTKGKTSTILEIVRADSAISLIQILKSHGVIE